jgi:predicted cupin superfamily sugar epimerase/nucleoside phosphorylase
MYSSHFQKLANATFFKTSIKKIDYAIFSAMPEELDYIKYKFKIFPSEHVKLGEFVFTIYNYNNVKVLLISCGFGTTFIASALTLIYYHFQPKFVLFSGVAGGIDPSLKIGDIVIAEKAFEAEVQAVYSAVRDTPFESCLIHPLNKIAIPKLYSCNETLLLIAKDISFPDNPIIRYGNVVTSNKFPAPVELYQEIRKQRALSIDMETSAFYQIAWLLNIPALAIRGISNSINPEGTDENIHASDLVGGAETAAKVTISILDALILKLNMFDHENTIDDEAEELIDRFQLEPHPEGGYYARNFTSELSVTSFDSERYDGESRKAGSSIYYLLRGNEFSAFHILKSDEIWHYYKGSPVKIHMIDISGNLTTYILGNPLESSQAMFQVIIPANNWFAAEVLDKKSFSFVGCTVSPGFEFKDFNIADRDSLSAEFPIHSEIIKSLTRNIVDKNKSDNVRIKSKL